jgi:D-glycero-beta-D-manno-heptose-7-phosphate kinase
MIPDMSSFLKLLPEKLAKLEGRRLTVIGDIGLDEYVLGDVRRISPEAPVPVLEVQSEDQRLGLSANVAQNVASLGGIANMVAVVGDDAASENLRAMLKSSGVSPSHLIVDKSRPTTRKLRVMTGPHHIVRVDYEQKKYLSPDVESQLIKKFETLLPETDGVIIEDYAKGLLSEAALQKIISLSRKNAKPVMVDPNRNTPARFYNGADLMTPNRDEALVLSGLDGDELRSTPNFIADMGSAILKRCELKHLIITRGKDGMTLFSEGQEFHLPTFARQVFDVTGAGDTVIAALGMGLVAGFTLQESCVLGNLAAGVVVGKVGSVPCTRQELLDFSVQTLGTRVNSVPNDANSIL